MEPSQPFTCYFCNKYIKNESEMGHISVCSSVLIPCPNKCGSYIPRVELYKHKKECVNRINRSIVKLNSIESDAQSTHSLDHKPDYASHYYKELFVRVQDELRQLSNKVTLFEQNRLQNGDQYGVKYNLQMYKELQIQHKQELEKLKYQQQYIYEWKKAIDLQLENLKHSIAFHENTKREKDAQWLSCQQKFMDLDKLQMDYSLLRDSIYKNQNFTSQANLEFAAKLDEFKDFFDQENAAIGALWNDHRNIIENLRKEVDDIRKTIEEQKAKHTSIVFDVKTTSRIAIESSEKIEIQERELKNLKRSFEQMKLDLEILEELTSIESSAGQGMPGYIIWKISDFETKLSKSKESDSVLRSQIFYSHNFGYRIRILVHLNGLKKWKDRYALISIHVLKGEYDGLLKWPCHIEGTVTLRDQEDLDNPKNFTKYIAAKRLHGDEDNEEPQESSASYIFIPHNTLMRPNYLKEDTIYLDIRINSNKQATETTL